MEHVNGDMEDLFRRAAEKYPLRTDGADWDRLAAALDKDPGSPSDADTEDKRRRRGIRFISLGALPRSMTAASGSMTQPPASFHCAIQTARHRRWRRALTGGGR